MIKFLIAATLSLLMLGAKPTYAADRTDCKFSLSEVLETNKKNSDLGDFKFKDFSEVEQTAVIASMGPPPASEPYTIGMGVAEGSEGTLAQLLVHDGDCGLVATPTLPLAAWMARLGIREAVH